MALLLSSTPALAPASPAPSEIDSREQFRKALVTESLKAVRDNRLPDALAAWRRAYEIRPDHKLACNIGKAEMEHGSAREAATHLAICLRLAPPSPPPGDKLKLARYAVDLKKARQQVGAISILVSESGADIAIDAHPVGTSPLPEMFVDPGAHQISVSLAGYKRQDIPVTVEKSQALSILVTLEKSETAEPLKPAPASLPPASLPPASLPSASLPPASLPPASLPSASLPPASLPSASLPPASLPSAPPSLPPSPLPLPPPLARAPDRVSERSPLLIWVGASASFIGVGLTAGFTVAANVEASNRETVFDSVRKDLGVDCTTTTDLASCRDFQSADQRQRLFADVAVLSLVGTGFTAAVTAIHILYPRAPIRPAVGKGGSVLVAEW